MFTVEDRDRLRDWIASMAKNDPRVTAGAMTGSLSAGAEDRWSDIDVAFGVADGVDLEALLDDWTEALRREFGLLHYWALPFRSSLYRVFLFPSGLEADVAAVPQRDFGARGPRFRALFGATHDQEPTPPPDPRFLIGLGWHHVLHANSSIERAKPWRAEYWISALRDHTLELACLRLGEDPSEARGIDRLHRGNRSTRGCARALARCAGVAQIVERRYVLFYPRTRAMGRRPERDSGTPPTRIH